MDSNKGTISVIVPVYNVAPYLERCVESIIQQTYSKLEIILVDDGSTDMSGELCDQLRDKDDRIIVIHKENGGLSDARNAGLDIATGEFVSFIDSDDYIDVGMYRSMVKSFENIDVSMVVCGIAICTEKTKEIRHLSKETKILNKVDTYISFFRYGEDIIGESACNKIYRKNVIGNIRFKVGLISEDIEFLYRFIYRCELVACVDQQYYYYMKRLESITTKEFFVGRLDMINTARDIKSFIQKKLPELFDYALLYELSLLINSWNDISRTSKYKYKEQKEDIVKRIRANRADYEKRTVLYSNNYYNYASFSIVIHCHSLFSFFWKRKEMIKKMIS